MGPMAASYEHLVKSYDVGDLLDGSRLQEEGDLRRAFPNLTVRCIQAANILDVLFLAHGFFTDAEHPAEQFLM